MPRSPRRSGRPPTRRGERVHLGRPGTGRYTERMSDTAPLRVLAVTSELPWPLDSGGRIRTFQMARAIAAGTDFRLVVPVGPDRDRDVAELARRGIRIVPAAGSPRTGPASSPGSPPPAVGASLTCFTRRHARAEMFRAWRSELARFRPAVAYLDHLDGDLFGRDARATGVPTALDLHNVYSLIVGRLASGQSNPLKRWFFRGEARRLARVERFGGRGGRPVSPCRTRKPIISAELGGRRVRVAPNGVDCPAYAEVPTGRPGGGRVVLYVGTMSWVPNADAARFLATEVLPQVRQQLPDVASARRR